jgi:hypothetical protein
MNFHVRVVTYTIPDTFGIALTAMVVLTVEQSVFVTDSLLQRQPSITVCTCNILNSFFFHTNTNHLQYFNSSFALLGFVHRQPIHRVNVI